jgi:hypothetical protein
MANITEEYIEKINISLEIPPGITICLDDYLRSYIHQPHSQTWLKIRSSSTKRFGFASPDDTQTLDLPLRNGWEIINQQHDLYDKRASSRIVAEKDNHAVLIDLEDRLRGAKSSLLDFFDIYRDCIHAYDA